MTGGPLAGVRVLDLTDDLGRFATKLLAEWGADVVRVSTHGTPGPAMADAAVAARGGLLDWWYDASKPVLPLHLDGPADAATFRRLAAAADLVVDTEPPGRLGALGLGYDVLAAANPALVQVSLTPFGLTGPRAAWQATDLVSAALGGVLSVTGLPDAPLAIWGRQANAVASFYAVVSGLAALHVARSTGTGQHVDVSAHQGVISCTEQVLMQWAFPHAFPTAVAPRQGSLHWSGGFEVIPCRTGYANCNVAGNLPALFAWMASEGVPPDLSDADLSDLAGAIPILMREVRKWALTKDARALCEESQERHFSFGDVRTVADVVDLPQHVARGFYRPVHWDGPSVCMPGPVVRFGAEPAPTLRAPGTVTTPAEVLERWGAGGTAGSPGGAGDPLAVATAVVPATAGPTAGQGPPLAGLRVLDFTWVLAGPYAGRLLGDLGADVIRIQTAERAQASHDPSHPYYVMWNRNKRHVALDMKHPGALEVARKLVEASDVLVENYAAGVLDRWGLSWEVVHAWNPRLIYVVMSGCGHDGPWRSYVSYAPTVHALCGLTALTNPPGRIDLGTGFALNDHMSGLTGAAAILAAVESRRRTGLGQRIDLSQLEVGTYLVGPAVLDALANGRTGEAIGNRDAFDDMVPHEAYRCGDGEWLALACRDDRDWQRLCAVTGSAVLAGDPSLRTVAGRREHRGAVDAAVAAWARTQGAEAAMRALQAAGVPAGMVADAEDMAERDEQLAERDWLDEVAHFAHGAVKVDRFPALFGRSVLPVTRPSPSFGEHLFEVYGELCGMDDEAVATAIGDGLFA